MLPRGYVCAAVSGLDDVSDPPLPEHPQLCIPYAAGTGIPGTGGYGQSSARSAACLEKHGLPGGGGAAGGADESCAAYQLYVFGASLCRVAAGAAGEYPWEVWLFGGIFPLGAAGGGGDESSMVDFDPLETKTNVENTLKKSIKIYKMTNIYEAILREDEKCVPFDTKQPEMLGKL